MSYLVVDDLVKLYGHVQAVDHVSFAIEEGTFMSLLGPSGCGKTTTLRCIAGLETPSGGQIRIAGATVYSSGARINVPVHRRELGMVFQNYALWPHMTVFHNIAFPLRLRRMGKRDMQHRVGQLLEMLRLEGLGNRYPSQISGGQQQRVALARALVHDSKLLLFDEPLSNLDAKLREQAIFELKQVHKQLGKTILYVTHNQVEGLAMSDLLAVMNHGVIKQLGHPREVYQNPVDHYVANFVGKVNTAQGVMIGHSEGFCEARVGSLVVRGRYMGDPPARNERVEVFFRPEMTTIAAGDASGPANVWSGKVAAAAFLGDQTEFSVALDGFTVRVSQAGSTSFSEGSTVTVTIDPADVRIVAAKDWGVE